MVDRIHRLPHIRYQIRLSSLRMVDHRIHALLHCRRAGGCGFGFDANVQCGRKSLSL